MSQYTTEGRLQATVDFGFQGSGVNFAKGKPTTELREFYALDDYFTDADSNAYSLPTFLGNHDMGRVGSFLRQGTTLGRRRAPRPRPARPLADVPHPRPAGRLLRRRAGLLRAAGRAGRHRRPAGPRGHVRQPGGAAQRQLRPHRHRRDHGRATTSTPTTRCTSTSPTSPRSARDHPALADGAQVAPVRHERRPASSPSAGSTPTSRSSTWSRSTTPTRPRRPPSTPTSPPAACSRASGPPRGATSRPTREGRVTVTVPPLSAVVYRANAKLRADQRLTLPGVHLARRHRHRHRSGRGRGERPGWRLHRGHLRLAPRRHAGVAGPRHRRQRAVPRLPRRPWARPGYARGVPGHRPRPRR